jgi:hypothetical protein
LKDLPHAEIHCLEAGHFAIHRFYAERVARYSDGKLETNRCSQSFSKPTRNRISGMPI